MKLALFSVLALAAGAGIASAQAGDPVQIAIDSGVCGDGGVISAVFNTDGSISATCDVSPTAFVIPPAGLAAGGVLVVGLLGALGGGDGTGSTSGTD